MSLSINQIIIHPAFHALMRQHARALLAAHEKYPRLSSVFASQQRAMLGSIGLGLYFTPDNATSEETSERGIKKARFLEVVAALGVASRNTADAFLKEMLQYGHLSEIKSVRDKRLRLLEPTGKTMDTLRDWAMAHVETLDALDGGSRADVFSITTDAAHRLHLFLAGRLVEDRMARPRSEAFTVFAWLNQGKLLMLRILAASGEVDASTQRVTTDIASISELAAWMNISQSHLTRKFKEAEATGSLGWSGKQCQSPMWISEDFYQEIKEGQASRLALFDEAFDAMFSDADGAGAKPN